MCSMIHSTNYVVTTTVHIRSVKKVKPIPIGGRFYAETDEIKYRMEGNLTISARVSLLVDS